MATPAWTGGSDWLLRADSSCASGRVATGAAGGCRCRRRRHSGAPAASLSRAAGGQGASHPWAPVTPTAAGQRSPCGVAAAGGVPVRGQKRPAARTCRGSATAPTTQVAYATQVRAHFPWLAALLWCCSKVVWWPPQKRLCWEKPRSRASPPPTPSPDACTTTYMLPASFPELCGPVCARASGRPGDTARGSPGPGVCCRLGRAGAPPQGLRVKQRPRATWRQ